MTHPYYETAKQAQAERQREEIAAYLQACDEQRKVLANRRVLS